MAGPSASDVRSILSLDKPTPGPSQPKPGPKTNERARKPEGISRELYSLIGPSAPTLAAQFAKPRMKPKPSLGGGGCVKWEWKSFKNGARSDGLRLSHWTKAGTDPEVDYSFAKYNIQTPHYVYSQDEYSRLLEDSNWTKEETDYLFELVKEYDSRWYVIHDRYDFPGGRTRSLEDIKDRYCSVCRKLIRQRPWAGDEASKAALLSSFSFDKDREVTRKQYVASLENRTPDQIAEEDMLYVELKRLEQTERRFKKDRDELLRTLLGIESGLGDIAVDEEGISAPTPSLHIDTKKTKKRGGQEPETPVTATPSSSNVITLGQPKKAQSAKSAAYDALHCIHRIDVPQTTTAATKATHAPVYLRSFKIPAPKITVAPKIAQVMGELGIQYTRLVMPTRDNCTQLENLLDAAHALIETKKLVDKVDHDIKIAKERLGRRDSETRSGDTGDMDVDEDMEGGEDDGDDDGRGQSVVSGGGRSSRPRKHSLQSRRSMSISSVDTSATGAGLKKKRRRE